jgi:hypothetical protein
MRISGNEPAISPIWRSGHEPAFVMEQPALMFHAITDGDYSAEFIFYSASTSKINIFAIESQDYEVKEINHGLAWSMCWRWSGMRLDTIDVDGCAYYSRRIAFTNSIAFTRGSSFPVVVHHVRAMRVHDNCIIDIFHQQIPIPSTVRDYE